MSASKFTPRVRQQRVRIVATHCDYPAPDGFTTIGRLGTVRGWVHDQKFPNGLIVDLDATGDLPSGLTVYVHAEHTEPA